MISLAGLIAPALAVLPVPLAGSVETVSTGAAGVESAVPVGLTSIEVPAISDAPSGEEGAWRSFAQAAEAMREAVAAQQVRIESRVIIRIAPGPARRAPMDIRRGMFSPFPAAPGGARVAERRMAQCLPVGTIAGVQPDGGSRLMLFMRDQRMVSATLEKGCNARDYYSGFLVERSVDGMICAGRDKLLSRSGANCTVGKLTQVIALDDE